MPSNQDQDDDQNGSESDDENIMLPQYDLQQRRMIIGKQMILHITLILVIVIWKYMKIDR